MSLSTLGNLLWAALSLFLWITRPLQILSPAPPGPEIPAGFHLILSDVGVALYEKDYPQGNPDFVQVVDLSQGAAIQLYHGTIAQARVGRGVYGGDDPKFYRQSLQEFWFTFSNAYPAAFCITNGQFFLLKDNPTGLAFPLKKDGQIVSDGYGIKEFPGQKLMLEIWSGQAKISELTPDGLYNSTAPNILAGLTEEANKSAKNYVGRTFVGVDDQDQDGRNETVLVFNTKSAREVDAASVLRSFGADQVMMLDGGGSTQLICQNKFYVSSDRLIPQALGVMAGDGSLLSPTATLVIPTQTPPPPEKQLHSEGQVDKASPTVQAAHLNFSNLLWIPLLMLPLVLILIAILIRVRGKS